MPNITFKSSGVPSEPRVLGVRGSEALSELYAVEVLMQSATADVQDLDLTTSTLCRATVAMEGPEGKMKILGVLRELEIERTVMDAVVLRAVVVPQLWQLTLSSHSRIFTQQSVPDVIQWVLEEAGFAGDDFALQLTGSYAPEEHICQYHESDFAFISRWMRREGMYFFFDHSGDKEKLVITDDKSAHEPGLETPVPYRPVHGDDASAGTSFSTFRSTFAALPAEVRVRDYDYARPALDVSGTESASSGLGQVVLHGERTFAPDDARRLAALRAQELSARSVEFQARGAVLGLHAGLVFELEEHPRSAFNQKYLVTQVTHTSVQAPLAREIWASRKLVRDVGTGYHVAVKAVPANVQWRPESHAASSGWPRVSGYECGVIDGEADSEYAQLDDQGRYLVRMNFDESDNADGKSSTRLRMMQPHAGNPEGWHFPLRKGTEVVVTFLGGDPDRPVIAGAIPNAQTPSPVTSSNNTLNILRTGGRSLIEVEDEDGKQHVYIYTPPKETYLHLGKPWTPTHYAVLHTKGDCLFEIGSNQDINVGGKLTEKVKSDVTESYHTSQTSTVTGHQRTNVTNSVTEIYGATQRTVVTGGKFEQYLNGQFTIACGARTETYNGGQETTVIGDVNETYGGGTHRKTVVGATTQQYIGTLTSTATGAVTHGFGPGLRQTWGATTIKMKQFEWQATTININAPSWKITTPSTFQGFGGWKDCKWFNFKTFEALSNATVAVKIEVIGVNGAAVAAKGEMTAINVGYTARQLELGGIKIEAGILQVKLNAIKKYL